MKYLFALTMLFATLFFTPALFSMDMQHGFILSYEGGYAEHLVAQGHHSHQLSVIGELRILSGEDGQYQKERTENELSHKRYFTLMAQNVDITNVKVGQVLQGHIIESPIGDYTPNKVLVNSATFTVKQILMSVPNPFFADQ